MIQLIGSKLSGKYSGPGVGITDYVEYRIRDARIARTQNIILRLWGNISTYIVGTVDTRRKYETHK